MSSEDQLDALARQVAELRAEYARVGRPILDQIVRLSGQIEDIKRERGELFYVDYKQYHATREEECDNLEEARSYAQAIAEAGIGYVMRIRGPGVALGEHNWAD